jgi:hypothetical protein
MYCYVDESGNTGANLFDPAQPVLYYGLVTSKTNLDVMAEPLLRAARAKLGVERLHANALGVGRLSEIAQSLGRFALKRDVRFSLYKVVNMSSFSRSPISSTRRRRRQRGRRGRRRTRQGPLRLCAQFAPHCRGGLIGYRMLALES